MAYLYIWIKEPNISLGVFVTKPKKRKQLQQHRVHKELDIVDRQESLKIDRMASKR